MSIIDALILGIIQGLTEFFPVSSFGYLVIFKNILNVNISGIIMEISLHFGTVVAICAAFHRDIFLLIKEAKTLAFTLIGKKKNVAKSDEDQDTKILLAILIGNIPTVIIALLCESIFERFFNIPALASIMIIITGFVLWLTRIAHVKEDKGRNKVRIVDALIVGAVQGIAIIPGISRSGTTIATASFLGIKRELAAKFSFLLSVPVIIGGVILKFDDISEGTVNFQNIIIGTIASAVVGYLALFFLVKLIKKGKFHLFSYYCWSVGIIATICFLTVLK